MVFAATASDSKVFPPMVFPAGMKANSETYCQFVLEPLNAWLEESYSPINAPTASNFVLMQDGALTHTSRATQGWLEINLGIENFWPKTMWPPDANPLDFSFWAALARAVGAVLVPQSRAALICKLEGIWDVLEPSYVIRTTVVAWEHLR